MYPLSQAKIYRYDIEHFSVIPKISNWLTDRGKGTTNGKKK